MQVCKEQGLNPSTPIEIPQEENIIPLFPSVPLALYVANQIQINNFGKKENASGN